MQAINACCSLVKCSYAHENIAYLNAHDEGYS